MEQKSTIAWLKFASGVVIAFGIFTWLSIFPAVTSILEAMIDMVIWPIDGAQKIEGQEFKLVLAVSGGIITGWGVLFWQLSTKLYPRDPQLARSLILASMYTWFIIDGIGSYTVGAPLNILFNIPFLLIFVIPLWKNEQRLEQKI